MTEERSHRSATEALTSGIKTGLSAIPHLPIVITTIIMIGAWELIATQFPPRRFPGLVYLAENVWMVVTNSDPEFDTVYHMSLSLTRIAAGASISIILAVVWGVLMGLRTDIEDYFSTPLFLLLTLPSLFWAFFAIIWWGITVWLVPIFVIVMITFPYLTVNIWEGTKDLDQDIVEMASSFDAGSYDVFRHILLPHLTPYLYTTVRMGFGIAWKLSLVAELFGTSSGIGAIVAHYYQVFDVAMVIAWAVPPMLLMLAIEIILQWLEENSVNWRPKETATVSRGLAE